MRRLGLCALMVLVEPSLLAFYGLAALVTYRLLVAAWVNRPSPGTAVALVVALTALFGVLSYQVRTVRLLAGLDAVEVPRGRAPELYRRVDRLAERMDVQPPRLFLARMAVPNALALGGARSGVVVLDRGLVRLLAADELEAIVAHVESRDSLVQTLGYSAMRTVVGLVTVALTLLIRAHSRRREYAADDRAAEVTGRPLALARALAKIERVSQPRGGLLSPLYVRGDEGGTLTLLFSTHPATDDRIERLVERARSRR